MRPRRLELEGFASFRERIEVDFADAELFALCGPTGAGKSSLIDAITFALYGVVSRYDSQNLVWPVISQGMNEARVRLDFTVGLQAYTAVRVVRRTGPAGATTKEARLEDAAGRTLAGNASELSDAVERLIGLPFEHFTRCVVLPQGEFAQFLQAKPGERQELLVRLLGLDVYQGVAQRAHQRGADAGNRVALLEEQLAGDLARATPEAVAEAREHLAALDGLVAVLDGAAPELDRLAAARDAAGAAARDADTRAASLRALKLPPGIERLARGVAEAAQALARADAGLDAAVKAREVAQAAREALPERARLDVALEKHEAAAALRAQAAAAEASLEAAEARAASDAATLTARETDLQAADDALQHIGREHAAHHLAEHLRSGEPCPVCLQRVRKLPARVPPADLQEARHARSAAQTALDAARTTAARSAANVAAGRSARDGLGARRQSLEQQLADAPSVEQARQQLLAVDAAEQALRGARAAEEQARGAQRSARDAAAALERDRDRAARDFDHARDALAALGLAPPPARRDDLHADWTGLLEWAADRAVQERDAAQRARAEAGTVEAAWSAHMEDLRAQCLRLGVQPGHEPRLACAAAHAHALARAHRLDADRATAVRLRDERARLERDVAVARTLARLLDARNFERWLMNRALRLLVAEATRVLRELSAGAFSLTLDSRNEFLVIDHRNADEKRMARTLSGGESFLASLALALALAEHVADLASGGIARIEALFLDEGFGTLDAATLDTVAAAIEELGARGRMVGLVTHVRDLADRMPTRFEVRKVGGVSTVEKVVA